MSRPRRAAGQVALAALLALPAGALPWLPVGANAADALPTVASINLCTDQLVLRVADEAQILTLSYLAAAPAESMLAAEARRFPPNFGSAEELLRHDPDVVLAGAYTNAYARSLLRELGYTVVDIEPARSIADIERNIQRVADAVGRSAQGRAEIAALRARVRRYRRTRPERAQDAIVVRPGGFTVETGSLAHELITLAGLDNVAAELGLDRWGSLSIETLLRSAPELVIFAEYRADEPSLANTVLEHPALDGLRHRVATASLPSRLWACGLPESLDSVDVMRRAATARRGGP